MNTTNTTIDYRNGQFECEGITADEIAFTHDHFGSFNITRAMPWILKHGELITVQLEVADTIRMLMRQDLDAQQIMRVMQWSDEELKQRSVMLYLRVHNGQHILLDGNHRLCVMALRAADRRARHFQTNAYEFTLETIEPFRIKYFWRTADSRTQIAPTDVLEVMRGVYSNPDGTLRDERGLTSHRRR